MESDRATELALLTRRTLDANARHARTSGTELLDEHRHAGRLALLTMRAPTRDRTAARLVRSRRRRSPNRAGSSIVVATILNSAPRQIVVMAHTRCDPDRRGSIDGPSSGSALMNRTAAGVCSSSGIRSSACFWSSTLTPSQTFGSGHERGRRLRACSVSRVRRCGRCDRSLAAVAAGGEVRAHPLRPLREDLERVLRRQRHHREHAIDERVRHVLVKQVRHAVDEHARRLPPGQRLEQRASTVRTTPVHCGPAFVCFVSPSYGFPLAAEPVRLLHRVAVHAPGRDDRAAAHRVPRLVGPLDRA
jgi:hypothetical protein